MKCLDLCASQPATWAAGNCGMWVEVDQREPRAKAMDMRLRGQSGALESLQSGALRPVDVPSGARTGRDLRGGQLCGAG